MGESGRTIASSEGTSTRSRAVCSPERSY